MTWSLFLLHKISLASAWKIDQTIHRIEADLETTAALQAQGDGGERDKKALGLRATVIFLSPKN